LSVPNEQRDLLGISHQTAPISKYSLSLFPSTFLTQAHIMTDLIFWIGCSCSMSSQFDLPLLICFQYCDDEKDQTTENSLNKLFNDLSVSFAHVNAENLLVDVLVIEEIKSWDAIHSILSMALESIAQNGYVVISNVHPMYSAEAEYPNPHSSSFWLGDSWKVWRWSSLTYFLSTNCSHSCG
jgi:hypothetical protein